MSKLLIFNWKMNPDSLREAVALAKASDYENTVVAPPFPFIEGVGKNLKKAKLGAQDVYWEEKGAFTGEVSARELKDLCVEYALVGHSERRHKLGETDEMIAKKMKAAVNAGLIPVLCVGETVEEKNSGKTKEVIKRQLERGLSLAGEGLKSDKRQVKNKSLSHDTFNIPLIIAYEPVWAIGTGNPETPKSALETIKFIKKFLKSSVFSLPSPVKILYGGSVNSKNLGDYLKYDEIAGALVGGASLKKEEVKKMAGVIANNANFNK